MDATPALRRHPTSNAFLAGVWSLGKETIRAWRVDRAPSRAAALAYYSIFALGPTLIIALSIAGALLGEGAARGELQLQLEGVLGDGAAKAVERIVAAAAHPGRGLGATVVGVGVLVFATTGAFVELQNALNAFWKVPPRLSTGVRPFIKRRAISVLAELSICLLLLASVLSSAALSALRAWLPGSGVAAVWVINGVLSFGVITGLFALIFKVLPACKVAWKDVWVGALLTSLLFNVGKFAISAWFARRDLASAFGVAGAVVVVMGWVYYSSMILFLGAEFTHAFARIHGSLRGARPPPAGSG